MRVLFLLFLLFLPAILQAGYVFVRDGQVQGRERDLPAVGIRRDTGDAVLNLHGADAQTRKACGWYEVVPFAGKVAEGQQILSRGVEYDKNTDSAKQTVVVGVRIIKTPEQRIAAILDDLQGDQDERVAALVKAVAAVITNKITEAVSVEIPAAKKEINKW